MSIARLSPIADIRRRRAGARIAASIALAAAVGFATATAGNPAAAAIRNGLFGTTEIRKTNVKVFYKWTGMIDRFRRELQTGASKCSPGLFSRCPLEDWKEFVDSLRGKDRMTQIKAIHRQMNRKRYIIDPRNWGVKDYWATPVQFGRKNGDCEDYAISKFMALRRLGFPNDRMRIVVLQDLNLNIAHAVLVVYYNGQRLVLDNQIRRVVPASRIRHYKPYYSLNETTWWLHRR